MIDVKRKQTGFTMIELLVVATILSLLTTIAVVSFQSANARARDGKRKADLEQIRAALELYKSDPVSTGIYPNTGVFSTMLTTLSTNNYISSPLPADPKNTGAYAYNYAATGNGSGFCLCANLEVTTGNSSSTSCSFGTGTYYCLVNP